MTDTEVQPIKGETKTVTLHKPKPPNPYNGLSRERRRLNNKYEKTLQKIVENFFRKAMYEKRDDIVIARYLESRTTWVSLCSKVNNSLKPTFIYHDSFESAVKENGWDRIHASGATEGFKAEAKRIITLIEDPRWIVRFRRKCIEFFDSIEFFSKSK